MARSKKSGQSLSDIADLLQCPTRKQPITLLETNEMAVSGDAEYKIPMVSGQPVLVDFENSILDRQTLLSSSAVSLIASRRITRPWWKRALLGVNRTAPVSAHDMLQALGSGVDAPVILIAGGGTASDGAEVLYESENARIIAFDVYASPLTDFVADAHAIPLKDESVDAVWIEAVLEHVLSPHEVADEIWRVLKPDGLVYAATPFMQPVHEQAYDFSRFTESGHRWLFRKFSSIDSGVTTGPGTALFQMMRYAFGAMAGNRKVGSILSLPFFWLRFIDLFSNRQHSSDAASGVYFLGRKSQTSLAPRDMPAAFKGVRK